MRATGPLLKTLLVTCLIVGCSAQPGAPSDDATTLRGQEATSEETALGALVPCTGSTGSTPGSSSYQAGAPDLAADGGELDVRVAVVVFENRERCRLAVGALVEIWHTGDGSSYVPDRWRTARRTSSDGTTSYTTVRPSAVEGFPHLHIRVTSVDGIAGEWTIGVDDSIEDRLELRLLLGDAPPVSAPRAPAPPATDVAGV